MLRKMKNVGVDGGWWWLYNRMNAFNATYSTLRNGKNDEYYAESIILRFLMEKKTNNKPGLWVEKQLPRRWLSLSLSVGVHVQSRRWHRLSPVHGAQILAPQSPTLSPLHRHSSGSSGVCGLPACTYPGSLATAGARRCLTLTLREVAWSRSRSSLPPCSEGGPAQL